MVNIDLEKKILSLIDNDEEYASTEVIDIGIFDYLSYIYSKETLSESTISVINSIKDAIKEYYSKEITIENSEDTTISKIRECFQAITNCNFDIFFGTSEEGAIEKAKKLLSIRYNTCSNNKTVAEIKNCDTGEFVNYSEIKDETMKSFIDTDGKITFKITGGFLVDNFYVFKDAYGTLYECFDNALMSDINDKEKFLKEYFYSRYLNKYRTIEPFESLALKVTDLSTAYDKISNGAKEKFNGETGIFSTSATTNIGTDTISLYSFAPAYDKDGNELSNTFNVLDDFVFDISDFTKEDEQYSVTIEKENYYYKSNLEVLINSMSKEVKVITVNEDGETEEETETVRVKYHNDLRINFNSVNNSKYSIFAFDGCISSIENHPHIVKINFVSTQELPEGFDETTGFITINTPEKEFADSRNAFYYSSFKQIEVEIEEEKVNKIIHIKEENRNYISSMGDRAINLMVTNKINSDDTIHRPYYNDEEPIKEETTVVDIPEGINVLPFSRFSRVIRKGNNLLLDVSQLADKFNMNMLKLISIIDKENKIKYYFGVKGLTKISRIEDNYIVNLNDTVTLHNGDYVLHDTVYTSDPVTDEVLVTTNSVTDDTLNIDSESGVKSHDILELEKNYTLEDEILDTDSSTEEDYNRIVSETFLVLDVLNRPCSEEEPKTSDGYTIGNPEECFSILCPGYDPSEDDEYINNYNLLNTVIICDLFFGRGNINLKSFEDYTKE